MHETLAKLFSIEARGATKLKETSHKICVPKWIDKSKWKRVRLGDVAVRDAGKIEPDGNTIHRWVAADHIDEGNIHVRRWSDTNDPLFPPTFRFTFKAGNVLLHSRNPKKVVIPRFDGITGEKLFVLKARESNVLREDFLAFVLMSEHFSNWVSQWMSRSVNKFLNWSAFEKFEFDLPPLDQQRRIAEILWAVDEVLLMWIEVKTKLDQLRTSYAVDAYRILGTASTQTKLTVPLSDLVELNPTLGTRPSDETEVSFIAMADVSEVGRIIHSEARQYKEVKTGFTVFRDGDILFAKITPCMENGKGALVSDLCNGIGFGSTEFHVLRPKLRDDAKFIFHLTMLPMFRRAAKRYMRGSAGQQRVPSDFLRDYRIAIVDRSRRKEIGETLASMTQQIEQISIMQTKLGCLTSKLLNGVLGGS